MRLAKISNGIIRCAGDPFSEDESLYVLIQIGCMLIDTYYV
jgi:hypothetical protein